MSAAPLDRLMEKLNSGDPAAAEEVFRAYEPYLRMVVRRSLPAHLRAKFDSVDVVQSVWADVFQGFRDQDWRFTNAAQLKSFLAKVARNRLIDRVRHYGSTARERSLGSAPADPGPPDAEPRPSQVAQARELWDQIMALCPPAHRPLVVLKQQGCSLAEIAERTGLHPSSVRRILYGLARRLAAARQGNTPEIRT